MALPTYTLTEGGGAAGLAPALDDVQRFLSHLAVAHRVRRVFVAGYSAGGILVQHLATTPARASVCGGASAAGALVSVYGATTEGRLDVGSFPMLFWNGVDDRLVPLNATLAAIARYAELGLPHELYRLPTGHNVMGFVFPNGTTFATASKAFLDASCA